MTTGVHIFETIAAMTVGVWLMSVVMRRRSTRGGERDRDKREMQESIRQFNRRDHRDDGEPWL